MGDEVQGPGLLSVAGISLLTQFSTLAALGTAGYYYGKSQPEQWKEIIASSALGVWDVFQNGGVTTEEEAIETATNLVNDIYDSIDGASQPIKAVSSLYNGVDTGFKLLAVAIGYGSALYIHGWKNKMKSLTSGTINSMAVYSFYWTVTATTISGQALQSMTDSISDFDPSDRASVISSLTDTIKNIGIPSERDINRHDEL